MRRERYKKNKETK